jgi:signal peptidase
MKAVKKIGTIVISVILWAIILLAALYAFTTMATKDDQSVATILGYTPMTVETNSMKPTFQSGDLIFIKKCDTSKLKEGDIITFHTIIDNQYALNTHRIQKIDEVNGVRSYTTVGDNNNGVADQHVISDGDIVGKYIGHVTGLGKVMKFLSSSMGFLIVIVLPMLLFFIYQVYNLIMISIRLKKAIAVENAQEMADAQLKKEEAEQAAEQRAKEKDEAQAALEEAKRLKEEAEALRAQAEEELKKAKRDDGKKDGEKAEEQNEEE